MATRSPGSSSIYLYLGPEEGEKHSAIAEIRTALNARYDGEVEQYNYYAFDTSPHELVGILRNGSLFGSAIFARYKAVDQLKRKEEIAPLLRYAESPNDRAVLILESSEISVHNDLGKVSGPANKKIFWEMFEGQKNAWLSGYFRRHKVAVDAEAMELLLELVENTTIDLRYEADKLIAFSGERIGVEEVERFVYHAKEENVFTLFDAIVARKLERALEIVEKLLVQEDAVQLVAGITRQLDRLFLFQQLRSKEHDEQRVFDELAEALNTGSGKARPIKKMMRRGLVTAAKQFPLTSCTAMVALSSEIDALLRTVPAELHRGLFQQYVYSLTVRDGRWRPGRSGMRAACVWEYPGSYHAP